MTTNMIRANFVATLLLAFAALALSTTASADHHVGGGGGGGSGGGGGGHASAPAPAPSAGHYAASAPASAGYRGPPAGYSAPSAGYRAPAAGYRAPVAPRVAYANPGAYSGRGASVRATSGSPTFKAGYNHGGSGRARARSPGNGYGSGYGQGYGYGYGYSPGVYFSFVPVLPWYASSLFWNGVPYYYADDTYYVWNDGQNQYQIVPPPVDVTAPQTGEVAPGDPSADPVTGEIYTYPTAGQDAAQQQTDRYECYRWAADQSGFDPTQPRGDGSADRSNAYRRAEIACLQGRGYSVQ